MIPPFTSHNVVLPDGTHTAPDKPVVAESGCCRVAVAALAAAFPDPVGVTVADLGCLEGGYAAEFARHGYQVTGFEVRDENYACALAVAAALDLPNLRFVQADVRELGIADQFDAVFCCGLLYHLDRPVAFLNMLGEITGRLLILNTHISLALHAGHPEGVHQPGESCGKHEHNEGRAGHWFEEVDGRWSSWGNPRSFWLAKDELTASLHAAGFDQVTEHPDWRGPDVALPFGSGGAFDDRVMFTAGKP